ncbi:PASTA domain-containing protein [Dactylosporangium sp. NPDC051484]|uniref:PASTA domain-containing protein n=1 Tax=Dactylosporangium sp. NPDC051484 TaxID=3154942 RepID=UPI003450928D
MSHRIRTAALPLLAALLVAGCAARTGDADGDLVADAPSPTAAASGGRAVPDLHRVAADDAMKRLAGQQLVGQARYVADAGTPPGLVVRTEPAAGAAVAANSVVVVEISGEGGAEDPAGVTLGELAERHPEAFVGTFIEAGKTVVATNPGTKVADWRARLDKAAAGAKYEVRACKHGWSELAQVKSTLTIRDWSADASKISFGLEIDASRCAVKLSSTQLTDADAKLLQDRYGDRLLLDRNSSAGRT